MVDIVDTSGKTATIPDTAITVVSGPYPHDTGTISYIRGSFGPGAFQSSEDAAHLVARLQLPKPLTGLTRPNNTPVWVKAGAISMVRLPLDTEIPNPPQIVRCVVMVGGFHQAVREDVDTVKQLMAQAASPLLSAVGAMTAKQQALTNELFTLPKASKQRSSAAKGKKTAKKKPGRR
jgi:hypothetical protein